MRSDRNLILIVGLQKSGSTLMQRLLLESGLVTKPFIAEGDAFWGNVPPFSPRGFPAGEIYQRANGERGHVADASDAPPEVCHEMRRRFEALESDTPLVLNKSPYNTVRLPWLRKVFPEATIVAMIRRPVPNVFSLTKKYTPHEQSGPPPEEGWWGVKPEGWRNLVRTNKVEQGALQWWAVNEKLDMDQSHIDFLFAYHEVCGDPMMAVTKVLTHALGRPVTEEFALPPIRCFDDEFARGSRLRSRNRSFREIKSLAMPTATPATETIEQPPFTEQDVAMIETICEKNETGTFDCRFEALS